MRIAFADFLGWDFHVQSVDVMPMGGSHSAACYLARNLARSGHDCFFITHTSAPGRYDGVSCLSWRQYHSRLLEDLNLDVFICILTAGYGASVRAALGPKPLLILWNQHAHNQNDVQALRTLQERAAYDGFAMVSEWQLEQFHEAFAIERNQMAVLRNAIAPAFAHLFGAGDSIMEQKTKPPTLVYTSAPFRGLDLLLDSFGYIRKSMDVRLRVYSSMKVYQASAIDDQRTYGLLYQRCREMEGVEYIGSLPQRDLARELRGATGFAYPNTFPETSCISVMEAMAAGCFVVTSLLGALPETGAGYARLVPVNQSREAYLAQFAGQIIALLNEFSARTSGMEEELRRQVEQINRTATWEARTAEWLQWFDVLQGQRR